MDREKLKSIIEEEVKSSLEEIKKTKESPKIFLKRGEENKMDKGLIFGRIVRALVAGKGDPERAQCVVRKAWQDDGYNDEVIKALGADLGPSGGYLVPPQYSQELIELLTAKAVVRKMGAQSLPLQGTLPIPKLARGATAYFIGENQDAPISEPGFDQIVLSEKTLVAMVPISNKLIRLSSPKADTVVRDDLINAIALKEDAAFIRGSGTEYTPKGLLNWAASGNKFGISGSAVANVVADLQKAINKLESANVSMTKPGWLLHPRVKNFLLSLINANNQYIFKDEMLKGALLGIPFAVTTQIPANLGTGSNESEIYLVDFNECIIGDGIQFEIQVSTEATYVASGNLVSAFSKDQTLVKITSTVDFAVRHDEAVAVIQNVTWGA